MEKKRQPAKKVRIFDVVNGKYFAGSKEEFKPSYVITTLGQRVSRVNLIATVIDKFMSEDQNYAAVRIDDGTEIIRAKAFKESVKLLEGIELGDMVTVIGKLKEYNNEVYVNVEIVKKITDVNFESLRKIEILNEIVEQKKAVDEIKDLLDKMSEEELKEYVKDKFGMDEETLNVVRENLRVAKEIDYKPKILELIKSLDEGNGVEIVKIFELSKLPENVIESAVNELLAKGLLFEPMPAVLRVV
jgi:RPA family protein